MKSIFEIVKIKQVIQETDKPRFIVRSPQDVVDLVTEQIGHDDREVLLVLVLNTKNEVIALHEAHQGSLDASILHPREIMKTCILNNAKSYIIAHNHPSNNPEPSTEDLAVTDNLKKAGELLGFDLLDHLIVTNDSNRYTSFKENGHL